jgi:hypothetical protein
MHYAEFDTEEAAALLSAMKEYESNKWKFIGGKLNKPAKASRQVDVDRADQGRPASSTPNSTSPRPSRRALALSFVFAPLSLLLRDTKVAIGLFILLSFLIAAPWLSDARAFRSSAGARRGLHGAGRPRGRLEQYWPLCGGEFCSLQGFNVAIGSILLLPASECASASLFDPRCRHGTV